MKLTVSKCNSKMGKIRSISFTPIRSCIPDAPCAKGCYAKKAYKAPTHVPVRRAWDGNLEFATENRNGFFDTVNESLRSFRKPDSAFRWFVGGDILDQAFLDGMNYVARENAATPFLCFTKNHGLDFSDVPNNLSIVRSMWPNWGNPDLNDLPRAWMQDGTEDRIPEGAFECHHKCDSCFLCWHLRELKRDVVFPKH